jgi:hypothetical protein
MGEEMECIALVSRDEERKKKKKEQRERKITRLVASTYSIM